MVVEGTILKSEIRENLTKNVTGEESGVYALLITESILFQEEGKQIHSL